MELPVLSNNRQELSKVNVSDHFFACCFNEGLVHQVVNAYLAGGRQGTKAQKTRSERKGGGTKPWRQKGTGRARAGTTRSPLWRKGGITFATRPGQCNYLQKVNRKMYRLAISSIVSELIRQERLFVLNDINIDTPKTKHLIAQLKLLSIESKSTLLVIEKEDINLHLSSRNIPKVDLSTVDRLNPVELVAFDYVVMTVGSLKKLEATLLLSCKKANENKVVDKEEDFS